MYGCHIGSDEEYTRIWLVKVTEMCIVLVGLIPHSILIPIHVQKCSDIRLFLCGILMLLLSPLMKNDTEHRSSSTDINFCLHITFSVPKKKQHCPKHTIRICMTFISVPTLLSPSYFPSHENTP